MKLSCADSKDTRTVNITITQTIPLPKSRLRFGAISFHDQSKFERFARGAIVSAICIVAFFWASRTFPRSVAIDEFRASEAALLSYERYSVSSLASMLTSQAALSLDSCDTHAQRALLLAELPLAYIALKTGATLEFDSRIHSLEVRTQQILSCNPRDSFTWLVAFNIRVVHGQLDDRTFQFLDMSYQTSPNEAWIAVRRNLVAMPFIEKAPPPLRDRVVNEFGHLVRNGYFDEAAQSYLAATNAVRLRLSTELEQTTPYDQKLLFSALETLRRQPRNVFDTK
jgi:hypothetical protein